MSSTVLLRLAAKPQLLFIFQSLHIAVVPCMSAHGHLNMDIISIWRSYIEPCIGYMGAYSEVGTCQGYYGSTTLCSKRLDHDSHMQLSLIYEE